MTIRLLSSALLLALLGGCLTSPTQPTTSPSPGASGSAGPNAPAGDPNALSPGYGPATVTLKIDGEPATVKPQVRLTTTIQQNAARDYALGNEEARLAVGEYAVTLQLNGGPMGASYNLVAPGDKTADKIGILMSVAGSANTRRFIYSDDAANGPSPLLKSLVSDGKTLSGRLEGPVSGFAGRSAEITGQLELEFSGLPLQ